MKPLEWLGWKTMGARNRLLDRFWERRLGIETRGNVEVVEPDAHRYETFAYPAIRRVLDRLALGPEDVLVDIGCGKGRVLCCAARLPLRKVVGVDIDPALCWTASDNARRLRGRRTLVQVVYAPAQEFDFAECTACVLFNPFGPSTFAEVLRSVQRSLQARPREFRVAYVNPLQERILRDSPGFERMERWRRAPWTGLKQDVSFWRWRAA